VSRTAFALALFVGWHLRGFAEERVRAAAHRAAIREMATVARVSAGR
jgi:hypothetical protein